MKKRELSVVSILLLVLIMAVGCSKAGADDQIVGSWAYIHDEETEILNLDGSGKAVYKNTKYDYSTDDSYIYLTKGKTTEKYRYYMEKDELYFFEKTDYVKSAEDNGQGLLGTWVDDKTNWSFEFTDDGTFREDGYFPGYYSVDEEAGTIKLVYNDMFEDTVVHYSIEGDVLHVEYPWRMVRCTK